MSMAKIGVLWVEFQDGLNGRCAELDDVSTFCNIYASSIEEYFALWELLADSLGL